jgi:transposase
MPAPRKYPDEMRDRAIRLVLDIAEDAGSITAGCRRVGGGHVHFAGHPRI